MPRKEDFDILTLLKDPVATEGWVKDNFQPGTGSGSFSHDQLTDVDEEDHRTDENVRSTVEQATSPLAIDITGDSAGIDGGDIAPDSISGTIASGNVINDLVGQNMSVDEDGVLNVIGGDVAGLTGTSTQNGDGITKLFAIQHGLGSTPNWVTVNPKSEAASADHWISTDSTYIRIFYAVAPPEGANNLEWAWSATTDSGVNLADLGIDHSSLNGVEPGQHRTDENVISTVESSSSPIDVSITGDAGSLSKKAYLRHAIKSSDLATGRVRLDPGESIIYGPYQANGQFEVWRWGVMTGNGGADPEVKIRLEDAEQGFVDETASNEDVGDVEKLQPVVSAPASYDKIQFKMVNNSDIAWNTSGHATFYID